MLLVNGLLIGEFLLVMSDVSLDNDVGFSFLSLV